MEKNLEVIGNSGSVIYYNLNNQFSNQKKIVITKEILLKSFENTQIKDLFESLKSQDENTFEELVNSEIRNGIFDLTFITEFYSKIQESLNFVSKDLGQIKLKDYNFMSSVSNSKFDVTLRCDTFYLSLYMIEKGEILSAIKHLIQDYLQFSGNRYRINKIDNFQIEITLSEEIYKKVILKKEGASLLLSSSYGYSNLRPINFQAGSEIYHSVGDDFNFYKNNQVTAVIREQTKVLEKEINLQEKILSNEELMHVNELTKNINDAIIEMHFNSKGNLRISNLSFLENNLHKNSENGFIINKSSKNYDKISLVTIRDNLDEELSNPKYLLIRNHHEVKELLSNFGILTKIDGIIFNINFYMPFIDFISNKLDIDIVFYTKNLTKTLEANINFNELNIDIGNNQIRDNLSLNPFSSILETQKKEKDEQRKRLDNIDLSTPNEFKHQRNNQIQGIDTLAESLISSSNSSVNKNRNTSSVSASSMYTDNGKKKTAMQFLADIALNKPNQEELVREENLRKQQEMEEKRKQEELLREEERLKILELEKQKIREELLLERKQEELNKNQDSRNNQYENSQFNDNQFNSQETQNGYNQNKSSSFDDFFSNSQNNVNTQDDNNFQDDDFQNQRNDKIQTNNQADTQNENKTNFSLNDFNITNDNITNNLKQEDNLSNIKLDISKYENILKTNIISTPNVKSGNYFVDSNSISMVDNGIINLLITSKNDANNPSLNYVLPAEFYEKNIQDNISILINSINEFFLVDSEIKNNIFINLSRLDNIIKSKFLENSINKFNNISIVLMKDDLDLIEKYIDRIENIMIKDLYDVDDLEEVKYRILAFEKKFLMNKFK